MAIDPEREVTIVLPFWMVDRLKKTTVILSMFRDEADVRAVIDIIDAIHKGAMEYIRQEEGELLDYLSELDDDAEFILPPKKNDDEEDPKN